MEKMHSLDKITQNVKGSKKPFRDWVCPKCRHNLMYKQNYCDYCGLALDWVDTESIIEWKTEVSKYQVVPTQEITTGTPIPKSNINITC